MLPAARWRVVLPGGLPRKLDVYVNGVPQRPGDDYVRDADALLFARPLAREGRLGFWRWLSLFLGVAGTYRQDDSVDVVYELNGVRTVASGLEIVPPPG
ncbi:MAG: hypothetical protein ACXVY3_04600 [Gaiellaceae bacterium]